MADKELILYVYDQSFTLKAIVDSYSSLIWSDRYNQCGDFELQVVFEDKWKEILQKDYFCRIDFSDHWAIIEKIEQQQEMDEPPTMIVSGRSIECILERRIITAKKEFGSEENEVNVQSSIKTLINENFINPSNTKRKINNFIFQDSTDTLVTKKKFHESYNGDNLLDVIEGICEDEHLGYRILLNSSNQFVFSLFHGVDRSVAQNTASYVIFSPYFDNLTSSSYYSSIEEYKNFMYISKDEDTYITTYVGSAEPVGLARREIQEDASEFKKNKNANYTDAQIRKKAKKKLNEEYKIKTGIEGEVVPEEMYKYRTHYNVGDKVQFKDIYGNVEAVQISEVVISYDENGLSIIPTFEEVELEEDD